MQDSRQTRQVLTLLTVSGVNNGSFRAFPSRLYGKFQYTPLCITRLHRDHVLSVSIFRITVDGMDATEILLNHLKKSETDVVILGGVTFGGFNIVNVRLLNKEIGIPVIVFSAEKPKNKAMKKALMKNFSDWELRWSYVEKLGPFFSVNIQKGKPIFYEAIGCGKEWAEDVLKAQCINSRVPEAVRVAKMIARGVSLFFSDPD
jgi:endonuclease V-like protein UPF0215 family